MSRRPLRGADRSDPVRLTGELRLRLAESRTVSRQRGLRWDAERLITEARTLEDLTVRLAKSSDDLSSVIRSGLAALNASRVLADQLEAARDSDLRLAELLAVPSALARRLTDVVGGRFGTGGELGPNSDLPDDHAGRGLRDAPGAFELRNPSAAGSRPVGWVRPRPQPATLEVAAPAHGSIRVSGLARFFPAHTVHARKSTAVVAASNCELQSANAASAPSTPNSSSAKTRPKPAWQ